LEISAISNGVEFLVIASDEIIGDNEGDDAD
jgi:hypothetical protein